MKTTPRTLAPDRRSLRAALCFAAIFALGCEDSRGQDSGVDPGDAGRVDAGRLDAGEGLDSGPTPDAGDVDAGATDAGPDAGATDAGEFLDAGPDASADEDAGQTPDAGRGRSPGPGDLVVVEIQGNPQIATDEQAEYIELLNVSGRTLDLTGVRLTHVFYPASGSAPDRSTAIEDIDEPVIVAAGGRVLLTRSSGGFFGGADIDFVYSSFVFQNSSTTINRLRLMVPTWDETEPPEEADVIDEVFTGSGTFQSPLRARAWQLDPAAASTPSTATNDDPSNFCHTAQVAALEYRNSNWGTPGDPNDCD